MIGTSAMKELKVLDPNLFIVRQLGIEEFHEIIKFLSLSKASTERRSDKWF